MSLTDDWKAKKIDTSQRYWVIEKGVPKPTTRLMNELGEFIDGFGYPISRKMIKEVLAPCDYDHLVELTEKVRNLSSKNENLLNLTANQDKEIETLKEDQEKMVRGAKRMLDFQSQTIEQLRQLLKECQTGLKSIQDKAAYPQINLVFEEDYDALFCQATDLLTKINEVLK